MSYDEFSRLQADVDMRDRATVFRIEALAIEFVRDWMTEHGYAEIPVDDENEQPSYARLPDIEDEQLDHAIGWLPHSAFHNPTAPAWNPVVRLEDLR